MAIGEFPYDFSMLHEFLTLNRARLIEICKEKVAGRLLPGETASPLTSVYGIPEFLGQLIKTLEIERFSGAHSTTSHEMSGSSGGDMRETSQIGALAALHGREMSAQGYTVDQVVHNYGDLCQAVTGLAFELDEPISVDEFRTLNRCLDNAIADAVTGFLRPQKSRQDESDLAWNERLGIFAHELRNLLHQATLALTAVKLGSVGLKGATGILLDRSLIGMRTLIDRSLSDVRAAAGIPVERSRISVVDLIGEAGAHAALEAQSRGCVFSIADVPPALSIEGDREMLLSVLGNLLQNAFKFTHKGTEVSLKAHAEGDRVLIEIRDHCGGLPPGAIEKMFTPFQQSGDDRSGLGLGLSISKRGVEANGGILRVRDEPGSGCVFTIDLPRR